MTNADEFQARLVTLSEGFQRVYRVKGRNLAQIQRRSKHLLPRSVRNSVKALVQANALVGHPKLEKMLDYERLDREARWIEEHLDAIDTVEIRKTRIINFMALLAFNILIVAAGFVVWLVWFHKP